MDGNLKQIVNVVFHSILRLKRVIKVDRRLDSLFKGGAEGADCESTAALGVMADALLVHTIQFITHECLGFSLIALYKDQNCQYQNG